MADKGCNDKISDNIQEAVGRISEMELLYDRLSEAVRNSPEMPDTNEDLRNAIKTLSEYMDSGYWMHDYRMDEEGMLPADLKRGVLSQDGLYNLLSDIGG